jgi:arylformamidase
VDALPLDVFLGPCVVVDASAAELEIGADAVEGLVAERVLFKTRNSELWERTEFAADFVRLGAGAARALVAGGVRLVGVDYLSVADPETHHVLLGAGVPAVEELDLRGVEPGKYRLVCLPLRLADADRRAAPGSARSRVDPPGEGRSRRGAVPGRTRTVPPNWHGGTGVEGKS